MGKGLPATLTILLVFGVVLDKYPVSAATPTDSGREKDELQVHVGETFEISSSYRWCWCPTIQRFPTGELMVNFRVAPDEINPEGYFSAYCLSRDNGRTWSRRYTMGQAADGGWSQYPLRDGTVWNLGPWIEPFPANQTQDLNLTLTKFARGGMEFTQIRDVPLHLTQPVHLSPIELFDRQVRDSAFETEPDAMPFGPILEASNGDLIATFYVNTARHPRHGTLVLIRSSDGGKTWNQYSTMAAPDPKPWPGMGSEGAGEGSLVRLADNRLYSVFRTGTDGYLGQVWSSDDGRTWTPPTSLPYTGVAPRMRRLSNGVLALTTGRPGPVVVMFSVDGAGAKWSHLTEIFAGKKPTDSQGSGTSSHYNDVIELEPGKLLVVYDSVPYGWQPIPLSDNASKNAIYGTFIEVGKR